MFFLADFTVIKPTVGLLFWTMVVFCLFWFLISRLAFRPIADALETRENDIQGALEEAEKARKAMADIKGENERILGEARLEQANILKEARAAKDKIVSDAKDEAKAEANKIVGNARAEIQTQKESALKTVKQDTGLLGLTIAEKLIKKQLMGKDDNQNYANGLIDGIKLN